MLRNRMTLCFTFLAAATIIWHLAYRATVFELSASKLLIGDNQLWKVRQCGKSILPQTDEGNMYAPDVVEAVRSMDVGKRLLFAGIFSVSEDASQRMLIRETHVPLAPSGVDIRFVICQPSNATVQPSLLVEQRIFGDLYVLDCLENMNEGKTVDYWLSVQNDNPGYDYYLKGDSDAYFLWHNVAVSLLRAPRCGFYGGHYAARPAPGNTTFTFRGGPGIIMSKDLVRLMQNCTGCSRLGKEDVVTGRWVNAIAGDKVQPGDWGPHYLDTFDNNLREPSAQLLGKINGQFALIHRLKHASALWAVHRHFVTLVSTAEVAGLMQSNFTVFEGHNTKFWDPYCTQWKHWTA